MIVHGSRKDGFISAVDYDSFEIAFDWVQTGLKIAMRVAEESGKEMTMTPQEELFAKFYNHEKVLVKDMDHIQLRTHREELQEIAFEAKARLVAADDETRERKAKTNNKEWLVTDTQQPYDVSAAINVVKTRAARMSKMDKMRKQLEDAGIDNETIKVMIGNLEQKATDTKLKTVTFNKPSVEVSAVQVKEQPNGSNQTPFDPTALKFGS
jgi:hypothetical protein